MSKKTVSGFSKLSKTEKIKWVVKNFFKDPEAVMREMTSFWHKDEEQQRIIDGFSENTISNFVMPYGVAPNFVINGKEYAVPMVIEESSVVAAASAAAKFWMQRGGFKAEVLSTKKVGQVHFSWGGDADKMVQIFPVLRELLISESADLTANMEKRGGGILDIDLLNLTKTESDYFQIRATFETCDSMGANFINSVLERMGQTLQNFTETHPIFDEDERDISVIMAILSNYTPECIVRVSVNCPVSDLGKFADGMTAETFAEKFRKAVRIARIDPYRATTHNKGIYNGVDAVVLATGNDFRAIEACGHTYAARDGQYRSLSDCTLEDGIFKFWLDLPLAVGTVGGLTKLHPMAKNSLELLGNPNAEELMMIIAATGLAQNFAAVRSLVTTGIQQGHMKMHLLNITNHLAATPAETEQTVSYFEDKTVTFSAVRAYLDDLRTKAAV